MIGCNAIVVKSLRHRIPRPLEDARGLQEDEHVRGAYRLLEVREVLEVVTEVRSV